MLSFSNKNLHSTATWKSLLRNIGLTNRAYVTIVHMSVYCSLCTETNKSSTFSISIGCEMINWFDLIFPLYLPELCRCIVVRQIKTRSHGCRITWYAIYLIRGCCWKKVVCTRIRGHFVGKIGRKIFFKIIPHCIRNPIVFCAVNVWQIDRYLLKVYQVK